MRKILLFVTISLLISGLGSGCVSSYTCGMTPSTTPITAGDSYVELGRATGLAFAAYIYMLPISEAKPAGKARDRAIRDAGADALIECFEHFTIVSLPYVTLMWTSCEGTAVKLHKKKVDTTSISGPGAPVKN